MDEEQQDKWRKILEPILGPQAAEDALQALAHSGADEQQLEELAKVMGNPQMMQAAMEQMQQIMSDDGASDWKMAHDIARHEAHIGGDPSVTSAQAQQISSALMVADLWLDTATELPPAGGERQATSRAGWVEATLEAWQTIASPVGVAVAEAMKRTMPEESDFDAEGASELPLGVSLPQMMTRMGRFAYAMQVGQGAGVMAREVFGSTDVGIPLLGNHNTMLLPRNIEEFGAELDIDSSALLHYLAVREAAHARLFAHVPWLPAHLLGAVEQYARGIDINLGKLEDSMRAIDPTNPNQLRDVLGTGIFDIDPTPAQKAALDRLETALALVEGWVEEVTSQAVAPHIPESIALREIMRRRRAAGGPAEDTFRTLVGLELRPKRSREAARLWQLITVERGIDGRDQLWQQLDLMPTAQDLDNPEAFGKDAGNPELDQLEAALSQILAEAENGPTDRSPRTDTPSADSPSADTPSADSPSADSPSADTPDDDTLW